jgi:hypothetical protein
MPLPMQTDELTPADASQTDSGTTEQILAELSSIARCPLSKLPLRAATVQELAMANARAAENRLWHQDGTPVRPGIQAGLVSQNDQLLYVFREGIAFLISGCAIDLLQQEPARQAAGLRAEKQNLQSFYDQIGWVADAKGEFEDSLLYEDLRPISADYLRKCHRRVMRFLAPSGRYFLDAASGPVQYKEYIEYSEHYHRRVCVDLSFRALTEARRNLGGKGLYVLGDITNLPFVDRSMDGLVSLHTIYHVPADEQRNAFTELFRVLGAGKSGVVVYHHHNGLLARVVMAPVPILQKLKNALKPKRPSNAPPAAGGGGVATGTTPPPSWPYSFAHPRAWFTSQSWQFPLEFRVWRTFGVPEMLTWIRPALLGRSVLAVLYQLENLFPRLLGRLGEYPMLVIRRGAKND